MKIPSELYQQQGSHRLQTPPPVATTWEATFSTSHFLVAVYVGRDITCKHDVVNIQHAHCGLVGPDRGARKVGPFIAKPKAACGLCFHQLGGHVELPWLMRTYDVIHNTGST